MIPALQDQLTKNLTDKQGLPEPEVRTALRKWHTGEEPATLIERGCFSVFEQV